MTTKDEIEILHIGENRLIDVVMKDVDEEDLDIASLSFLAATFYQHGEVVESINLFPDADPRITYVGSILTVELTKTISAKLTRGYLRLRVTSNNPDTRFTDGEQHIDIGELTVYNMTI